MTIEDIRYYSAYSKSLGMWNLEEHKIIDTLLAEVARLEQIIEEGQYDETNTGV